MSCIAVLDVGKTNKKLLVFDETLSVVDEDYTSIAADESGPVHVERVDATAEWFIERLGAAAGRHEIGAVSVTTHGATCVCAALLGLAALRGCGLKALRDDFQIAGEPVDVEALERVDAYRDAFVKLVEA